MGYKREKRLKGRLESWGKADMLDLATFASQVIAKRAFDDNLTVAGAPFETVQGYSTDTIYIPTSGVMPRAKGGELTEPRQRSDGSMSTPSMKFSRKAGGADGGYKEYKEKATGIRGVTLVASGALRRSLRVDWWHSNRTGARIGLTGDPKVYGLHLNKTWEWFGFSAGDSKKIQAYFRRALARGRGRRR